MKKKAVIFSILMLLAFTLTACSRTVEFHWPIEFHEVNGYYENGELVRTPEQPKCTCGCR